MQRMLLLLMCSATMSMIALFYMAATPFLEKRYSVTGCYYAWLIIVIGLIIPFRPQFGNAVVKVHMPGSQAAVISGTGNGAPAAAPVTVAHTVTSVWTDVSWWQLAAAVWLAGMILFLAYNLIRHYRFMKLAARWSRDVTDEKTLELFRDLKDHMGVSGRLGLQICDIIGSPMVTGLIKPRILMPETDFAEDELRVILKHELIHYKRKDLWYKCLVLAATAVHWFNPVVYLMAKTIGIQCELSCDAEVVRNMEADARQYYSETIIGVIRRQSKLKTALSTNFYGGKKGMRKRIFSIMDMSRKKTGIAVLCGVLGLTLGSGVVFAASAEPQASPPIIREDLSFGYRFLPDPETYSPYSSYGIAVSDDGERLLYNGQRVRLFVDEHSDAHAFFLDEAGTLDLSVIRNSAGDITGIQRISSGKAQEYRSAFFADDLSAVGEMQDAADKAGVQAIETTHVTETVQDTAKVQDGTGSNKYEQYSGYGVVYLTDRDVLQYHGRRVKLFVDKLSDNSFETFWFDKGGTVNLSVVRDSKGQITDIAELSEENAQEYYASLLE